MIGKVKKWFGRIDGDIARALGSNFIWASAAELLGKGILFILHIIWARKLGPEGYGLLATSIAMINFAWLAVDLGTTMYGIRAIAVEAKAQRRNEIVSELFGLRLSAGVTMFTFVVCASYFIPLEESRKEVVMLGSLYLLTYAAQLDWVMRGLNRFRSVFYILLSSFAAMLVITLVAIAILGNDFDPATAITLWAAAFLVGSLVSILLTKQALASRIRPRFSVRHWYYHIRKSIFFTLGGIFVLAHQTLPLFAVSYLMDNESEGLFAAAYRLIFTLNTIAFLIPAAAYPLLSRLFLTQRGQFFLVLLSIRGVMAAMAFCVVVLVLLLADWLVPLLLGSAYVESIPLLKTLSILIIPTFLRYSIGLGLTAAGGQRFATFCSAAAVLFTTLALLILDQIMIDQFSIICFAAITGEVTFCAAMYATWRYYLRRVRSGCEDGFSTDKP